MKQDQLLLERLYEKVNESFLSPRRGQENKIEAGNKKVQQTIQKYINGGNKGTLNLSNLINVTLPDNFVVNGDLLLVDTEIESLPKGLKVYGTLDASSSSLLEIPEDLLAHTLKLSHTQITEFPRLRKYYSLNINTTHVSSIPNNTKCHGDLTITYTMIENLPSGLHVEGTLNAAHNMRLQIIPRDLYVGGSLSVAYTAVRAIPASVHVGENLFLSVDRKDRIYGASMADLKQMFPGVQGRIFANPTGR